MPFTNKQIVEFCFKTQTDGSFKCRCGKLRKQAKGAGFQNLISHVFSDHKDYVAEYFLGLSSNSVSKFQEFERALLKKQEGKELCDLEQSFIRSFYVEETVEGRSPSTESVSFADRILASKRPKLELSLKWIPATSSIAEQLFSSARHIFSDNRKKMTPVNLEAILFLKANKKLWDAQVVKQATEKNSEDQQ